MTHHWFEPLADHMGAAYLRYSFTKGTRQEVDHLVDVLGLGAGMRVLELSHRAGAVTGRILADLGAVVVKIEPPGGEPARLEEPTALLPSGDPDLRLPLE